MSKHTRRNHAVGLNRGHEMTILESVNGNGTYDPDYAIRRVTGSREGVRKAAQGLVDKHLRSGGELPLPVIELSPSTRTIGYTALSIEESL